MISLSRAIEQAESGRASHHSQLAQLNSQLAVMNENMAREARLTDQLAQLTTRLEMLQQSLETQSKQQHASISAELKALSSAMVKLARERLTQCWDLQMAKIRVNTCWQQTISSAI